MSRQITPEMIAALNTLRVHARYHSVAMSLRDAINTLDNADFFVPIDEARDELEADTERPCGCGGKGTHGVDHAEDYAPLDPAEWGDTTREDMARHQNI